MLAHHRRRHQQRGVALDVRALDRVHAVGDPDTIGVLQDAKIHAAATRGAAFDLKARMCGLEALEDVVDGKGLRVHGRAAGAAGTGLGDELVVVPLDVVDTKLADKLVHAAVDVVERIRIGQIEHLLSAALQRQSASGGRENPIRVVTGHIGIGVDHFRLEPQAEFHTLGVHVVGERLQ